VVEKKRKTRSDHEDADEDEDEGGAAAVADETDAVAAVAAVSSPLGRPDVVDDGCSVSIANRVNGVEWTQCDTIARGQGRCLPFSFVRLLTVR